MLEVFAMWTGFDEKVIWQRLCYETWGSKDEIDPPESSERGPNPR